MSGLRLAAMAGVVLTATLGLRAAEPPPDDAVAARVNDREITVAAVKRMVISAVGPRPDPSAQAMLAAQALEQLVQQALVAEALDAQEFTVSDEELDEAVKKFEQAAATKHKSLDQLLAERGLTKDGLRRGLAWEVRWNKYVDQHLGDAELEAYFNEHAREFDGSEVRVSHILLRPGGTADLGVWQAVVRQAAQLRSEIVAGNISFADAARRYSSGPSRLDGGDLGFIPRREQMVEPFSKAAFDLHSGEISQPVLTPFGVHLIQATDSRPGDKTWQDARDALKPAAAAALYQKLADEARPTATIEYTGVVPHLDPQTHLPVK